MTSLFTVDEEAVTAASQSDGAASATASSVVDTNLKRTLSKMGTFETEEEEHKNRRKLVARRIKSFKKSGQNAVVGSQSKEVFEFPLLKTLTDEIEGFEDVFSYEHIFSSSDDEEVIAEDNDTKLNLLSKRAADQTGPLDKGKKSSSTTSQCRTERTVAKAFLFKECTRRLRLTVKQDSPLLDNFVWERVKDDLRVIGYIDDISDGKGDTRKSTSGNGDSQHSSINSNFTMENSFCPLSCTEMYADFNIYKAVLKQLPILFAARLSTFRLFCHLVHRQSTDFDKVAQSKTSPMYKTLKKATVERVILHFQNNIMSVPPFQRSTTAHDEEENTSQTRMRINMTELGVKCLLIKSWQPTVSTYLIPSISKSLIKLSELLGSSLGLSIPAGALQKNNDDGYYFKSVYGIFTEGHAKLSTYQWKSSNSVTNARILSICMLAPSISLCGLFSMMQLWGSEDLYRAQCRAVKSFVDQETKTSESSREINNTFVIEKVKRKSVPLRSAAETLQLIGLEGKVQFARTEAHGGDAAENTTLPQTNSVPVVIVAKGVEPNGENTEALPTTVAKVVEPVKENAEGSAMATTIISEEHMPWTDTVIAVGSPKNAEGMAESIFFFPTSSPSIASTSSMAESPLYAYTSGASYKTDGGLMAITAFNKGYGAARLGSHIDCVTCPVMATGGRRNTIDIWQKVYERTSPDGKTSKSFLKKYYKKFLNFTVGGKPEESEAEIVSSWKKIQSLRGHKDWVTCLCSQPPGLSSGMEGSKPPFIVSGSRDKSLRLWSYTTDTPNKWFCLETFEGADICEENAGHRDSITSCDLSHESGLLKLASGSADSIVNIWDASSSAKPLQVLDSHAHAVRCVKWNQGCGSAGVLATGSDDECVIIWDTRAANGGKVKKLQCNAPVLTMCWGDGANTGNSWLAAGGGVCHDSFSGTTENVGGWLRIFDCRTWKPFVDCSDALASCEERTFYSSAEDKRLADHYREGGDGRQSWVPADYLSDKKKMWEGEESSRTAPRLSEGDHMARRLAHKGYVKDCKAIRLADGSDAVVSLGEDNRVKIWKLNFRDGIDTSPDRVLAKKSKTSLVACLSNTSTRKRTVILNALEVVPS